MLRPIAIATAVSGTLDIFWAMILTMTVGKGDIPAMLRFVASGPFGDAPQCLQAIERRKRIGCGQPRPGRRDLAGHGMDRIRRRRQQIADHQIALGDPWPLIEQPRGLIERLEVEFDQRGAKRGPAFECFAIGFL